MQVQGLRGVTAVVAGERHSVALRQTAPSGFGGTEGQLGYNTSRQRPVPVQVQGLSNIVALAASDYDTVALRQDGTVWA